jgi:precorrin-3B synthase
VTATLRRGTCPGLVDPMPTGDGLLARLAPLGTVSLDAFASLCAAARRHGSGIVEITSRGSIQVRGLTPASAKDFAAEVGSLDIDLADGLPVTIDPLSGLDPAEVLNAGALAAALRARLAGESFVDALGPKVSVVIDGGGALGLDKLPADIRLRAAIAKGQPIWQIRLGGTATSSRPLGAVHPDVVVEAGRALLATIAQFGPRMRAHELVRHDPNIFFFATVDFVFHCPTVRRRPIVEPIGAHPLRDGSLALGLGLPFGHAHVDDIDRLIEAAGRAHAQGVRICPGRVLLAVGVAPAAVDALRHGAERLGFVVRADDARLRIAACAGAPICSSGEIPARAMAPAIAEAAAPLLDGSFTLHLSGCRKGCAHSGSSALTIVGVAGRCGMIVDGPARQHAVHSVAPDALAAEVARIAADVSHRRRLNETSAQVLLRLGKSLAEAGRG